MWFVRRYIDVIHKNGTSVLMQFQFVLEAFFIFDSNIYEQGSNRRISRIKDAPQLRDSRLTLCSPKVP